VFFIFIPLKFTVPKGKKNSQRGFLIPSVSYLQFALKVLNFWFLTNQNFLNCRESCFWRPPLWFCLSWEGWSQGKLFCPCGKEGFPGCLLSHVFEGNIWLFKFVYFHPAECRTISCGSWLGICHLIVPLPLLLALGSFDFPWMEKKWLSQGCLKSLTLIVLLWLLSPLKHLFIEAESSYTVNSSVAKIANETFQVSVDKL
jgi:hypothetical protein